MEENDEEEEIDFRNKGSLKLIISFSFRRVTSQKLGFPLVRLTVKMFIKTAFLTRKVCQPNTQPLISDDVMFLVKN